MVACIFGFPNTFKGYFILVVFAIYLTRIIVKSMVFAFSNFLQSVSLTEQMCTYMMLCVVVFCYPGLAEWLMSKSIQHFTWPLEVDTDQLIKDYKSNTLSLEPINRKHFKFTVLPREACQSE